MKRLFTVLLCTMVVAASFACGEDKGKATKQAQAKAPTQAQKKQQERMSACNKQAGEKKVKGDARKKFMSACLEGKSTVAKVKQGRTGECNHQAAVRNLKGEQRKAFMSSCLRG
jgi:Ni/Co efflux regulator RcnB